MLKYLLLLVCLNSNAQIIKPVLPNISKDFRNIRDFTLYKDEAYFSAQNTLGNLSTIVRVRNENQQWMHPEIASFSGKYHDIEPFVSHDGLTLLFASNRPKNKTDQSKDYDIWYVTRKTIQDQWSKPINFGSPINSERNEFYPSLATNGNLYFTANNTNSKGKDDIYISEYKNNKYQKPYSLSGSINSIGDEYNAFIAPNEMYIIFGAYKRPDSMGSGDLYISSKDKDGNWSPAENMGDKVNSKYMDYCPYVDTKNNILYFTSKRNRNDASDFKTIQNLLDSYNGYENGMSRIYKTNI